MCVSQHPFLSQRPWDLRRGQILLLGVTPGQGTGELFPGGAHILPFALDESALTPSPHPTL